MLSKDCVCTRGVDDVSLAEHVDRRSDDVEAVLAVLVSEQVAVPEQMDPRRRGRHALRQNRLAQ